MMKVEQLMTRPVQTCGRGDRLDAVARIMWEGDCGCLPVVEQTDGGARVLGMITDRDVCMAAYTQGRPLPEIAVESVMAQNVRSCRPSDSITTALKILEQNQLHRLPVLDPSDQLIGMLSLTDVAREASREHGRARKDVTDAQIAATLEAISTPRRPYAVSVVA